MKNKLRTLPTRIWSKTQRILLRKLIRCSTDVPVIRLGSDYGGWWIPVNLPNAATCITAGVGEDISFDLELIDRFGCNVLAIDPTPKAISYVESRTDLSEKFVFDPVGLWSSDTVLEFFAPADSNHASFSATNLQKTDSSIKCRVEQLETIVRRHKIEQVDLLKIDIEGAEFEVIDNMLSTDIRPQVLCVEFDQPASLFKIRNYASRLKNAGYRPSKIEHWNVTFSLI
jgi:FkbM family methyltransferase